MIVFTSERDKTMTKIKEKVSGKEFAWYVVGGVFGIFGLTLMIFGIIGHHMDTTLQNNFIKNAEKALINAIKIPFDFRIWGIMFLLLGMFIIIVTLNYNAKKTDREIEKTIRRQQRLNAGMNTDIEVKSAVQIIEEPAPTGEEKKSE